MRWRTRVSREWVGATAPLGDEGGDKGAEAEGTVGVGEPGHPTIGGEGSVIEGGVSGKVVGVANV